MINPVKDLDKLDPAFREKFDLFWEHIKREYWHIIFIVETWRSNERQYELIAKGVSRTNKSKHLTGHAFDIAYHWMELYPKDLATWKKVALIANRYEIDWWFDLRGKDKVHFQCNGIPLKKYWNLLDIKYMLPLVQQSWDIIHYNQTPKDCAKFMPAWLAWDLTGHKLTQYKIKKMLASIGGQWVGMPYLQGCSKFLQRWNADSERKIFWYVIDMNSKELNNAMLDYGYSIGISRYTWASFVRDWIDWILDWIGWWDMTKRHATRLRIVDGKLYEINNKKWAPGFPYNMAIYKNYATHIKRWTIKRRGVLFQ